MSSGVANTNDQSTNISTRAAREGLITSTTDLHQRLALAVAQWREDGYSQSRFPAVRDILTWAAAPDRSGFRLRMPQVRALETYWYLRLVAKTPHISDLYRRLFPSSSELAEALDIPHDLWQEVEGDIAQLARRLRADDGLVRRYRLQALLETLSLDYPSYILALTMGTGKTVVIAAIVACEFALSMAYPRGPFVRNALVFAPGKTIIESLREIVSTDYRAILPPHLYPNFAAGVRFIFTRDGEQEIAVLPNSHYNVIVTNTEKIRIQNRQIRRRQLGAHLSPEQEENARAEVANRRLQSIAALPKLAIFSDEAHHTYGQALGRGLKKVRKTVDFLAAQTDLICVVNTTGTPYFKRQLLKDVVIWYGLSEGIKDGILKELAGNIRTYDTGSGADLEGDEQTAAYLAHVVNDFFQEYREISLPDGTPAKLALFFPNTAEVSRLRPVVEATLVKLGLPITTILEHHTRCENKEDFDRFKSKRSPHRVALLVDRGVEGWNVPALFACALARQLRDSNNFVLQATCRCLRQVEGNQTPARIYLSAQNRLILERQLQENFGTSIEILDRAQRRRTGKASPVSSHREAYARPSRSTWQSITQVHITELHLSLPQIEGTLLTGARHSMADRQLEQVGASFTLPVADRRLDQRTAAVRLATPYRLDLWLVYDELQRLYGAGESLPYSHLQPLRRQIEEQIYQHGALAPTMVT